MAQKNMKKSVKELKELVDSWQAVEDGGGSPTSAAKLALAKAGHKDGVKAAKEKEKIVKAAKAKSAVKKTKKSVKKAVKKGKKAKK